MSTTAQLYIDAVPDLGDGARRVTVDCKWARTSISMLPGDSVSLSDSALVVACLYRHESECGRCRTEKLWQRHADLELRDRVEDMWAQLQGAVIAERRN